jgi:hypothetical protein
MVIALTALVKISPLLAFVLVLRDILLYAARSLYGTWWSANSGFRLRVRITAVLFKLTIGGLVLLSYNNTWQWWARTNRLAAAHDALIAMTWIFVVWSYALLIDQIADYRAAGDPTSDDEA